MKKRGEKSLGKLEIRSAARREGSIKDIEQRDLRV